MKYIYLHHYKHLHWYISHFIQQGPPAAKILSSSQLLTIKTQSLLQELTKTLTRNLQVAMIFLIYDSSMNHSAQQTNENSLNCIQ